MAQLKDLVMPDPQVYPACSTCGVPYVLRRGHTFNGRKWTEGWAWFRDCKHKKADALMVDRRKRRAKKKEEG